MRSVFVGCFVLACTASCTFQSAPLPKSKLTAFKPAANSAGSGATPKLPDAATREQSAVTADASVDAGLPKPAEAPDAGIRLDAAVIAPRDDASALGNTFGTNPTPTDPMTMPQTGGLQCNGVYCPFTADPIKPCCTTQTDIDRGAARMPNHCGLDFAATGRDYFSDLCWQRDQLGVVDNNCPNVNVDIASQEPGCCTDQGLCGAVDTKYALGCHYTADQPPKSCAQSTGGGTSCDPLGAFAIRAEVDLAWGGRSGGLAALTDDGRGTLLIDMLANVESIDPDTLELHGTIKPCGVELPTFYSTTLCEAYEPIFPTTIWDSSGSPSFPLMGRAACLEPGCIESIDAQTILLGIQLSNPEAPWPTANDTPNVTCPAGKGIQCFPDQDGDKLPGLTVQVATRGMAPPGQGCSGQYTYQGAPLSASISAIFGGVRRTDRILLGVRVKVGGSARIADSCNGGRGSGVAEFANSRAWGCLVEPGTYNFPFVALAAGPNDSCASDEASFMDANLPIYDILAVGAAPNPMLKLKDTSKSIGPQLSMVRLSPKGSAPTCADVRAAPYPK